MIQLSIKEPKIEQFFNHSKDEIIKDFKTSIGIRGSLFKKCS